MQPTNREQLARFHSDWIAAGRPPVGAATLKPKFGNLDTEGGITGGCAGGNYCPDNFVTRRRMAVFLAKALGLNWPF